MAPIRTRHIATPRSANNLDLPRTTPSATIMVPLADPDLTKLRARLDVLTETDAIVEVLQYQTEALERSGDFDQYFIRLASVLEEYNLGQHASHVGATECTSFWQRVLTAQLAMRRRAKLLEKLESAWPEEILHYYGFRRLSLDALDILARMAAWHGHSSSGRSTSGRKQLAWIFTAVELNRAMLHRDSDWREKQRYSPNVGQLIGQHHSQSNIQDPWRPFETQDFRNAFQSVHISLIQEMKHKSWDWGRGKMWRYLKLHSLGFDQRGILVRATGRLDGDLMERFLLPKLPTTTGEQATVLRSPTIIASLVAHRSRAAVCDVSAPENRTTDHDYIGSHNLPRNGSLELRTAPVREDVPRTQTDAGRSVSGHGNDSETLPSVQQAANTPYFLRSDVSKDTYQSEEQALHDTIPQFTQLSLETGNIVSAKWPMIQHNLLVAITSLRNSQESGNFRHTDCDEKQKLEKMLFSGLSYVRHGIES